MAFDVEIVEKLTCAKLVEQTFHGLGAETGPNSVLFVRIIHVEIEDQVDTCKDQRPILRSSDFNLIRKCQHRHKKVYVPGILTRNSSVNE